MVDISAFLVVGGGFKELFRCDRLHLPQLALSRDSKMVTAVVRLSRRSVSIASGSNRQTQNKHAARQRKS
jgi:hypothetical protein